MIEILDGMYETINYGDSLGIRLFHNDEYEDYPEHWHTGIEMIMPVENGYTVCAGKENYELRENDVIIINTGVLHSLKAPETGKRIILQFSASLLYSVKEMETLLALLPPIVYIPYDAKDEKLYEFVRSRMDRIVTEYDEKKTFRESLIYAQLIEMFVTLGRVVMEGLYEKMRLCRTVRRRSIRSIWRLLWEPVITSTSTIRKILRWKRWRLSVGFPNSISPEFSNSVWI